MASPADSQHVLVKVESKLNTILVTEDPRGFRTLWFGPERVRQSVVRPGSPAHLESPYPPAMIAGLALVDRVDRLLILGLGGGTIPAFLRTQFPRARVDVVEIDPVVAEIAIGYFGFREDAAMRLHLMDARRFMERCDGGYDAIMLDCAGTGGVPHHLATREFLLSVRGRLAADGLAVGNIWGRAANRHYDSMVTTYRDTFDSVFFLAVREVGNQIIFALPRRIELTADQFVARARSFAERRRLPIDLAACAARGFRSADQERVQGSVLHDPGAG
jgi:spermidine synthase